MAKSKASDKGQKKSGKEGTWPSKNGALGAKKASGSPIDARLAKVSASDAQSPPNKPVKIALLEADRLSDSLKSYRKALAALPDFDEAALEDFPALIEALSTTERAWERARRPQGDVSLSEARKEAEAWRRDVMASTRYLARRDARAISELDRIAEGEGLNDLLMDLDDLVSFVGERTALFASVDDLPDVEGAKKLAATLRSRVDHPEAVSAHEARNRAFWALDAVVDEVRAALKYLLRGQPKKLVGLLSRYEAKKKAKQKPASAPAKPPVEPGA